MGERLCETADETGTLVHAPARCVVGMLDVMKDEAAIEELSIEIEREFSSAGSGSFKVVALNTVLGVLSRPEHASAFKRVSHAVHHCPIKPKQSRFVQEMFGQYPTQSRLVGEGIQGPAVEHTPEMDHVVQFCLECIQENVLSMLGKAGDLASLPLEQIMSVGHSLQSLSTALVCSTSDECA